MNLFAVENPFKKPETPWLELLEPDRHNPRNGDRPDGGWNPPVDVCQTKSAYLFKIDLPGLKAGDVRAVRIDELLLVTGERHPENGEIVLRQERPHGHFCRRLPLPADASREQIKASLTDGVLVISLRRLSGAGPRRDWPQRLEIGVRG